MNISLKWALRGENNYTDFYILTSLVWSTLLGLGCVITMLTGDWALTSLVWVCAIAMSSGLCFRNYAAPRYAMLMLACAIVPLGLAAIFSGELNVVILAAQVVAYLGVINRSVKRLNFILVKSMQGERDNLHRASHDKLTGLINRNGLEHAIDTFDRERGRAAGGMMVFCLDLDGFKPINDAYGHKAGDDLLQIIAARLRATMPARDYVVRLGGDEFVIIAHGDGALSALLIGERLVAAITEPCQLPDHGAVSVGVSIGCAMMANGERAFDDVLKAADRALYRAKAAGGNAIRIDGDHDALPSCAGAPSLAPLHEKSLAKAAVGG